MIVRKMNPRTQKNQNTLDSLSQKICSASAWIDTLEALSSSFQTGESW